MFYVPASSPNDWKMFFKGDHMKNKNNSSFSSLNPNAKIFEELKNQQPEWWTLLREDKDLYIDIRKDNYINVYYLGGSIAKIEYKDGFVAKTHQKYIGDDKPRGKTKNGNDKFDYDRLDLKTLTENIVAIKSRIEDEYSGHTEENEQPAEKWIQGKMIKGNARYIDSEFQFNQDPEIGKLRIDLIELSECTLSFVELKGISDSRLTNDPLRNAKTPEIIEQMEKYKIFIKTYENELKKYYRDLILIKQNLKLIESTDTKFDLNKTPKLIIANTYRKKTNERDKRINVIHELLKENEIDYEIIEWK